MITIEATARCWTCGWRVTGGWADVDRQAEQHAKQHPAGPVAKPA